MSSLNNVHNKQVSLFLLTPFIFRKSFLVVMDGENNVLGRFCNDHYPQFLLISGNTAEIIFKGMKEDLKNSSFRLSWKAEEEKPTPGNNNY